MKGYRFYAELPKGKRSWTVKQLREYAYDAQGKMNCVALLLGDEHRSAESGIDTQEALASTFDHADSDVSLGAMEHGHLRKCRRIPESLARKLHPRLFARLDQGD